MIDMYLYDLTTLTLVMDTSCGVLRQAEMSGQMESGIGLLVQITLFRSRKCVFNDNLTPPHFRLTIWDPLWCTPPTNIKQPIPFWLLLSFPFQGQCQHVQSLFPVAQQSLSIHVKAEVLLGEMSGRVGSCSTHSFSNHTHNNKLIQYLCQQPALLPLTIHRSTIVPWNWMACLGDGPENKIRRDDKTLHNEVYFCLSHKIPVLSLNRMFRKNKCLEEHHSNILWFDDKQSWFPQQTGISLQPALSRSTQNH